jgi:hypothetical protein
LTKHLLIPDVQAKEGVPMEHLTWIGQYIIDKKPDVIVQIGDFADMPSLSSYDKGKKCFEGRRYKKDIAAAKLAMDTLLAPLREYNEKAVEGHRKRYKPRLVLTLGNHEHRIERAVEAQAELEGVIGYHDLPYEDWEVHDFLKPVVIDGVIYVHYLANPFTGKPYTGTAKTQLKEAQHSFCVGHKQTLDYHTNFTLLNKQTTGIIAGACLTPDHKVLTSDLRYVELGTVDVGDKLVSFEEFGVSRKRGFKTGTVLAVRRSEDECFLVTLESGKTFKVTSDHYWLTRVGGQKSRECGSTYLWKRTAELRVGTVIPRLFDEWETLTSNDAGYLSGIYDGEGSLYARSVQSANGSVMQLSLSQKPGLVLGKCNRILDEMLGLDSRTTTNQRGISDLRIKGGAKACAKMLGSVRPIRLLNKFKPELLGSVHTNINEKIVSIERIGMREIVQLDIDEKTMIVEGYPHHNCYLHDEEYKGHQGNPHWRGIVMLHDVHEGVFDPMLVSLKWLETKYGHLTD